MWLQLRLKQQQLWLMQCSGNQHYHNITAVIMVTGCYLEH
uniref:Uncharacterized protein n=1 Tax=Rhizophora mucronata TaxID=61149 RepID=A0A2P2N1S9_RHIMU